jgi:hypothetical protein
MSTKKLIRQIEALGWRVEYTGGNHLRLTHPAAWRPVFTGASPSDRRSWLYIQRDMRRALTRTDA